MRRIEALPQKYGPPRSYRRAQSFVNSAMSSRVCLFLGLCVAWPKRLSAKISRHFTSHFFCRYHIPKQRELQLGEFFERSRSPLEDPALDRRVCDDSRFRPHGPEKRRCRRFGRRPENSREKVLSSIVRMPHNCSRGRRLLHLQIDFSKEFGASVIKPSSGAVHRKARAQQVHFVSSSR